MIFLNLLLTTVIILSSPSEARLDSLLSIQRDRAGSRSELLFGVLEREDLTESERHDLRFLLSYLPLGDIAMMDDDNLLNNVRLAREALDLFSWGKDVPGDVYLNFVLPHRVSQEPFVDGWRRTFFEDIAPRVEGMSMEEAALEVNHWCFEHATFKVSSPRDQDALTTIRAGLGRCEEEMILTICALRSVGIPARQCYTPYWPHTDNNHAWVEVWVDGEWFYTGGCEPRPGLGKAWFTSAAGRAMLVVSTAYGDYLGDEPILREYPRSTLINSTPVYGPVRDLKVKLVDLKGNPVSDKRVVFSLFNYGALMPASSLQTDENGECVLTCGRGSWLVGAATKKLSSLQHAPGDKDSVTIQLGKEKSLKELTLVNYIPPSKPEEGAKGETDSLFNCRIQEAKTGRESSLWQVWAEEIGMEIDSTFIAEPDSNLALEMSEKYGLDSAAVHDVLTKSRGNWGHLYSFLTGVYPSVSKTGQYSPDEVRQRFVLLETLTEKDLWDFSISALEDHYQNISALTQIILIDDTSATSPAEKERLKEYVIAPRINYEPSSGWRSELEKFLIANPDLISSKNDRTLLKWLRNNIIVEEQSDRLGPSLAPDAVLELRRGRRGDVERLYVGLCRVRGIAARFNPVSDELEVWDENEWQARKVVQQKGGKEKQPKKGSLVLTFDAPDSVLKKTLYMRDWAVQKWNDDHASLQDFDYKKPFDEIEFPQELSPGLYILTNGHRRDDGSAPVSLTWFEIKSGKQTELELIFRDEMFIKDEDSSKIDVKEVEIESGEESRQEGH